MGFLRSLVIYHGIPGRQRRLRRLYRGFVKPGDLAFDIGAHAGNRTRALSVLGCRVVAFEPQPQFARFLRCLAARYGHVVVDAAVAATSGRAWLDVSSRTPTVTTLMPSWRQARASESGFAGVEWDRRLEVDQVTLDEAIARFGIPAFVKIDVEGAEVAVLTGLTRPLAALSFEYLPGALDEVRRCTDRLGTLGHYVYNWSPGESFLLASPDWLPASGLLEALQDVAASHLSGDVYARRLR